VLRLAAAVLEERGAAYGCGSAPDLDRLPPNTGVDGVVTPLRKRNA
jgi:hypothetical protein